MDKDIKVLYCKKCGKKTEHLKSGYRKVFEGQRWRCLTCDEEVWK
jgi:RNase P subunit RPR2